MMKKKDLMIIFIILMTSIISFLIIDFTKKQGEIVCVKVNGEVIESYSLDNDGIYYINDGTNTLYIINHQAWIESAHCPDKLCVKQGKISCVGETIICLPYRLSITIVCEDYEY